MARVTSSQIAQILGYKLEEINKDFFFRFLIAGDRRHDPDYFNTYVRSKSFKLADVIRKEFNLKPNCQIEVEGFELPLVEYSNPYLYSIIDWTGIIFTSPVVIPLKLSDEIKIQSSNKGREVTNETIAAQLFKHAERPLIKIGNEIVKIKVSENAHNKTKLRVAAASTRPISNYLKDLQNQPRVAANDGVAPPLLNQQPQVPEPVAPVPNSPVMEAQPQHILQNRSPAPVFKSPILPKTPQQPQLVGGAQSPMRIVKELSSRRSLVPVLMDELDNLENEQKTSSLSESDKRFLSPTKSDVSDSSSSSVDSKKKRRMLSPSKSSASLFRNAGVDGKENKSPISDGKNSQSPASNSGTRFMSQSPRQK